MKTTRRKADLFPDMFATRVLKRLDKDTLSIVESLSLTVEIGVSKAEKKMTAL
jgi:hypothetical protein